ncbi:MAG: diguanylate cyclase [Pseudomonadales bacterium]|nr:diguanylate cyclase [Pseudomonadales bacterium]
MSDEFDSDQEKLADEAKPKLIMIDDSKLMRKSAVKMLGEDFEVLTAESGEQGLAMINHDFDIQVVFTDINMPGIDGYEVLKEIRTHAEEHIRVLPVVVVTGAENDDEAKELALSQGATDFITKPFNSTDLRARALAHANFRKTAQALQQNTNVDALTQLGNQPSFMEQLQKDISFISRHHQDLAVLLVEIDDFKELFLKIGRRGSDSVIKQIAKVLQGSVRKEDSVARIGLARFAVSLPTAKPEGAVSLAERICSKIAGFKATLRGETLQISVSMGVFTLARGSRPSVTGAMQEAEAALQDALGKGKATVVSREGKPDEAPKRKTEVAAVSIDQLLDTLAANGSISESIMEDALDRLESLWDAFSDSQKQRICRKLGN